MSEFVGKHFILDDVVIYSRPTYPVVHYELHADGHVTVSYWEPEPPTEAQKQLNQVLYPSDL